MTMQQMSAAMRSGASISRKDQIRLVTALSLPAILEQLVATLMSYIDTTMVGTLGYEATAAIGVVASTVWLFNGIVNAAAVGFSVQVAQYLGAGRDRDSRGVLCQAILFNGLFGLLLAVIAVILGQFLPTLLGADPSVRADAGAYFCIVGAFLPFTLASALYSSILRCSGSVRLPSFLNVGMCALDVFFNFFLIYPTRQIGRFTVWGAGLGVRGAALGTGLAMACIGLLMLFLLAAAKGPLQLRGDAAWRFNGVFCLRNAYRLATPAALERITLSLAQIVLTSVVTSMGAVAVAANYVAVQAESICYLPAFGVAAAATALVGQSIGAGGPDIGPPVRQSHHHLRLLPGDRHRLRLVFRRAAPGRNADPGAGGHRPEQQSSAGGGIFRAPLRREHRGHRRAPWCRRQPRSLPFEPLQHVGHTGSHHSPLHPLLRSHGCLGHHDRRAGVPWDRSS